MGLSLQQIDNIYKALTPYVPAEMVTYEDNKLYSVLTEISVGEYKYLWAMVLHKKSEAIKEKLTYLGITVI